MVAPPTSSADPFHRSLLPWTRTSRPGLRQRRQASTRWREAKLSPRSSSRKRRSPEKVAPPPDQQQDFLDTWGSCWCSELLPGWIPRPAYWLEPGQKFYGSNSAFLVGARGLAGNATQGVPQIYTSWRSEQAAYQRPTMPRRTGPERLKSSFILPADQASWAAGRPSCAGITSTRFITPTTFYVFRTGPLFVDLPAVQEQQPSNRCREAQSLLHQVMSTTSPAGFCSGAPAYGGCRTASFIHISRTGATTSWSRFSIAMGISDGVLNSTSAVVWKMFHAQKICPRKNIDRF